MEKVDFGKNLQCLPVAGNRLCESTKKAASCTICNIFAKTSISWYLMILFYAEQAVPEL